MPKSKVRKIASMGGKASGKRRHDDEDDDDNDGKRNFPVYVSNFRGIFVFDIFLYRW